MTEAHAHNNLAFDPCEARTIKPLLLETIELLKEIESDLQSPFAPHSSSLTQSMANNSLHRIWLSNIHKVKETL